MMYKIDYSKQFKKDLRKLVRSGCFDIEHFNHVLKQIASGKKLPIRYRDHSLKGDMEGLRECHIQPDVLLVYKIIKNILVLYCARLGSHSDLF